MRIHACKRRLKSLKMSSVLLPLNVRPARGNWSSSCGATGIAKIWWMNRSKDRRNKYFIFTALLVIQSSLGARQWSTDWGSKAWSGRSDRRVVRGLFSLCEKSTLFAPQWLPWNFWSNVGFGQRQGQPVFKAFCKLKNNIEMRIRRTLLTRGHCQS